MTTELQEQSARAVHRSAPSSSFFPPPVPTGHGAWSKARAGLLVGGLYVAGSVIYLWKLIVADPTAVIPQGGDQFLNAYFLGWVPHALGGLHNPFFTPNLNYPNGVNLLINTSQPLLGLLMWPFTALGGAAFSFNLLIIASMPVNAACGYVLARHLVSWRPAAFFAGAVVGFSTYSLFATQIGHLQLSFFPIIPLYLLVLLWVLRGQWRPRRAGVALGILLICQFFISTEIDVTLMVATAIIGGFSILLLPSARARFGMLLGSWAVAIPLYLLVLAYPLWFMLRGPGSISGAVQLVAQAYRSDLLAPIIPPTGLALAPHALVSISKHFSSSPAENLGYVGLPIVLAVIAITIWRRADRRVLVLTLSSLALFVMSLGGTLVVTGAPTIGSHAEALGGIWLPESLLGHLPLLKSLIPSRFAVYYVILIAMVLAIGADELRRQAKDVDARVAVIAALMVVCAAPLVPATIDRHPLIHLSSTPAYFTSPALRALPAHRALVLSPYPADPDPIGILWQLESGFAFAMPSGHAKETQGSGHALAYSAEMAYAALSPVSAALTMISHGVPLDRNEGVRQQFIKQLGSWHIAAVTATPSHQPDPNQSMRDMVWLLGRPTGHVAGTYYWNAPFAVPQTP